MNPRLALTVLLACAPLAGCYEEVTPSYYTPGNYEGEYDPLLEKLEHGDVHQELEQRFDRVARDR